MHHLSVKGSHLGGFPKHCSTKPQHLQPAYQQQHHLQCLEAVAASGSACLLLLLPAAWVVVLPAVVASGSLLVLLVAFSALPSLAPLWLVVLPAVVAVVVASGSLLVLLFAFSALPSLVPTWLVVLPAAFSVLLSLVPFWFVVLPAVVASGSLLVLLVAFSALPSLVPTWLVVLPADLLMAGVHSLSSLLPVFAVHIELAVLTTQIAMLLLEALVQGFVASIALSASAAPAIAGMFACHCHWGWDELSCPLFHQWSSGLVLANGLLSRKGAVLQLVVQPRVVGY